MTRVLICGGRDYHDTARASEVLNAIHAATPITLLIHGAATGADDLGRLWANGRGVPAQAFPANWDDIDTPPVKIKINRAGKPYNVLAGFNRNKVMLAIGKPDMVVALPGNTGTADMCARALKAGVPVMRVEGR